MTIQNEPYHRKVNLMAYYAAWKGIDQPLWYAKWSVSSSDARDSSETRKPAQILNIPLNCELWQAARFYSYAVHVYVVVFLVSERGCELITLASLMCNRLSLCNPEHAHRTDPIVFEYAALVRLTRWHKAMPTQWRIIYYWLKDLRLRDCKIHLHNYRWSLMGDHVRSEAILDVKHYVFRWDMKADAFWDGYHNWIRYLPHFIVKCIKRCFDFNHVRCGKIWIKFVYHVNKSCIW